MSPRTISANIQPTDHMSTVTMMTLLPRTFTPQPYHSQYISFLQSPQELCSNVSLHKVSSGMWSLQLWLIQSQGSATKYYSTIIMCGGVPLMSNPP